MRHVRPALAATRAVAGAIAQMWGAVWTAVDAATAAVPGVTGDIASSYPLCVYRVLELASGDARTGVLSSVLCPYRPRPCGTRDADTRSGASRASAMTS